MGRKSVPYLLAMTKDCQDHLGPCENLCGKALHHGVTPMAHNFSFVGPVVLKHFVYC